MGWLDFEASLLDALAVTISADAIHDLPFEPVDPEGVWQRNLDLSQALYVETYRSSFSDSFASLKLVTEVTSNTYLPPFPEGMGGGNSIVWQVLQVVMPPGSDQVAYDVLTGLIGDSLVEVVSRLRGVFLELGTPRERRRLAHHHPKIVRAACESHALRTYPKRSSRPARILAPKRFPAEYPFRENDFTILVPNDVGGLIYSVDSRLNLDSILGVSPGAVKHIDRSSWDALYSVTVE